MRKFILLALLLAQSSALAGSIDRLEVDYQTAVAMNGNQAARTGAAIAVAGKSVLRLTYAYTYSAGTALAIYCEASETGSGGWYNMDLPDSTGAMTAGSPIVSYASLTATRTFPVRIGVAGFRFIRCYPTVTGAAAGDLITSTYSLFN